MHFGHWTTQFFICTLVSSTLLVPGQFVIMSVHLYSLISFQFVFLQECCHSFLWFLHLACDTTSRPLIGKAWSYESLHFQIQQPAKVWHDCRKGWMVWDECSPENVRQRARHFLHGVWSTAVMCIASSQEWLIQNQRSSHSKPYIVKSWKSSSVTVFHKQKITVNSWTTPTTHKKTSGAVTVDSYGERSHWRRNSRRRCKTMGLLKKGFQYCLCNILTERG